MVVKPCQHQKYDERYGLSYDILKDIPPFRIDGRDWIICFDSIDNVLDKLKQKNLSNWQAVTGNTALPFEDSTATQSVMKLQIY